MSPTTQQLAEWEALADAATAGPWVWEHDTMLTRSRPAEDPDMDFGHIIETDSGYYAPRSRDRAFIAAAREGWPATIAALREARAQLAVVLAEVEADRVRRSNSWVPHTGSLSGEY